MGLAVSFKECFRRDTRCNANNISKEINTFRRDSSTHNASNVQFSYTALSSLKKLKYS